MNPNDLFELVDGRGPAPLFIPQHILDAINRCLLTHAAWEAGDAGFRDVEIAQMELGEAIIKRALHAGVQVCR